MTRYVAILLGSTALITPCLADSTYTGSGTATDPSGATAPFTFSVTIPSPGRSFYFSLAGSDANDGLTPTTAWQTIAKFNAGPTGGFRPGDFVYFRGGDNFVGVPKITPTNLPGRGDKNKPLVIDAYGTGKPTFVANVPGSNQGNIGPRNYGILIDGVSGVTIQNFIAAPSTPTQYGILIQNSAWPIQTSDTIVVKNCDVGGYATTASQDYSAEIFVVGYTIPIGQNGPLNNVQVLNCTLHGISGVASTDDNGISGWGYGPNISNAVYSGNTVYNIGGRPGVLGGTSGNGILFNGVAVGLAEGNLVHDLAADVNTCGGPAGIWAYRSNHITIQSNEVHHMHASTWTSGACDWAAFDFDGGVTDSTMQYNYSHDNDGPAWLLYQQETPWGNNVVRYNISENDNLQHGGGAALVMSAGGKFQAYGNTIDKHLGVAGACYSVGYSNWTIAAGSILANNICYLVTPNQYGQIFAFDDSNANNDISNLVTRTNVYYFGGAAASWALYGTAYNFAQWQNGGRDIGTLITNPLLAAPNGHTAASYQIQHGSPAIGAGTDLTTAPYSLDIGTRDFFGNAPSRNIGADAAAHP